MTARTRRLLAPTLPELWAFLAIALPVVAALAAPMSAIDLAYGVRAGQLMLASGSVLRTDPFTFTVGGQPWLDQQWLAQILFAVIHGIGGWPLVALARAALVGVLYVLVFASCRAVGTGLRTSAVLTLIAFLIGAPSLAMRPQLLGEVLFALTLLLVLLRGRHPRWLWAVPLLVATWANVHGTFFLGLVLVGVAVLTDLYRGGDRVRSAIAVLALSLLATGLTPWGLGIWPYALSLGTSPTVRALAAEWQVTWPLSFPGLAFYASVASVFALAVLAERGRLFSLGRLWPWAAFMVALAVLGVYAERGIAWWTIAAPSAAARLFMQPWPESAKAVAQRRSRLNLVVASSVVVAALLVLPTWRPTTADDGSGLPILADAPSLASAAVRSFVSPGERIFVPQAWASWLEYDVPGILVPVDSRFEMFGPGTWADYLEVLAGGPRTLSQLDSWEVTVVVGTDLTPGLISALSSRPEWAMRRQQGISIFRRTGVTFVGPSPIWNPVPRSDPVGG